MTTVRFFGHIHPKANRLTLNNPLRIDYRDSERGRTIVILIGVVESSITVTCECPDYTDGDHVFLWIRATDFARACVNVFAFSQGVGLIVLLDKWQRDLGDVADIVFNDPALPGLVTAYNIDGDITEVTKLIMGNPKLFLAIDDLIVSLTTAHTAVVNSYRAVEAIRHRLAAPGDNATQMWEKLRSRLNVDRKYVQFVADASTESRHGNRVWIDGATTREVHHRAWKIMNRYLELVRRKIESLPEAEFPLLAG